MKALSGKTCNDCNANKVLMAQVSATLAAKYLASIVLRATVRCLFRYFILLVPFCACDRQEWRESAP